MTNTSTQEVVSGSPLSGKPDSTIVLSHSVLETIAAIVDTEDQLSLEDSDGYTLEEQMRERQMSQRLLKLLEKEDVWEFAEISISVGATEITIDFEELGIPAETLALLKQGSRRFKKPRMTMFEGLEQAKHALQQRRKKIQTDMTHTGYSWVCTEANLPKVAEGLQQLYWATDELKREILEGYSQELRRYLESVAELITSVNEDLEKAGLETLDVESLLYEYKERFPSPQSIQKKFKVSVKGPVKINSYAHQAERNAEMQTALARLEEANFDREQIGATQRLFEQAQQEQRERIAHAIEYTEAKILDATRRLLDRIAANKTEPGGLSDGRKRQISEALNELQDLRALLGADSLAELLEVSEAIATDVNSSNYTKQQIDLRIDLLRDEMSRKFEFQSADVGHRSASVRRRSGG